MSQMLVEYLLYHYRKVPQLFSGHNKHEHTKAE